MSDPNWLEIALSLPADASNVHASTEDIAEDLWAYGEDELEARVLSGLTDDQRRTIALEAGRIVEAEGVLLAQAIARAAVFALEGRTRELARKRRRTR